MVIESPLIPFPAHTASVTPLSKGSPYIVVSYAGQAVVGQAVASLPFSDIKKSALLETVRATIYDRGRVPTTESSRFAFRPRLPIRDGDPDSGDVAPFPVSGYYVLNCSRLLRDGGAAEVRFVVNKQDSLNNRFRPIPELRTDAVFSVDDDLIVPCSTLRFAFNVWRSAPSAMVGFVPRIHWLADPGSNTKEYRYASWWSVWRTGTYSMVLSKASFFHRKYLDLYTNQMPPSIRDYVTKNRNCEDIAMSFLVANVTGAPPIWVKGRIFEIGSTGISSSKGHILQRSRCLSEFSSMYGHMPLVATTVKAVDGRSSWLW